MKKVIYLIITILIFVQISCNIKRAPDIHFEVSPFIKDSISSMKIKAIFKANDSGLTMLSFQNNAWGEDSLYNCLSNLRLTKGVGEIIKNPDSNRIEIKHTKNLDYIEFEYTLHQDTELPLNSKKTYRPIIQPEYFSIFSHNLFMIPDHLANESSTAMNIKIDWKDFPENYTIHNSFGSNQRVQELTVEKDKFHSAVFVGGDYKIHPINIQKNKVYLATRGDWVTFQDSTIVNLLGKTITAQRNFWKDHSQEYFTITMLPFPMKNGSSFQGTGLTNSFAISASNNAYLEIEGLAYLFNHELMHNWIGHNIQNANEEEQYWFSEGFTDYYTIKNIASNRILGLDEAFFIDEFNKIIANLHVSSVKEAPNSEINYENFWSNWDYEKLPYRRGAIFAFYLDHKIRKDSSGRFNLNDLMLAFLDDARNKNQKIDHPYFIKRVNSFLNDDIKPFFDKHIVNGKLMDLKAIFEDFEFEFIPTAEVFYRGYELDLKTRLISNVDIASNAYKAGMRDGDKALSVSVYSDPKKEATFKLLRGKKELQITFFPAKEIQAPQLIFNKKNIKNLHF
ncbi:hypothetical protein GTQ40_11285 [Flavobacteriaceae bacterium R38]|nr:hypothetical protein [Flavobacteriaceae bacterium R38]